MLRYVLTCITAFILVFVRNYVDTISIQPIPPFSGNLLSEVSDFDNIVEPEISDQNPNVVRPRESMKEEGTTSTECVSCSVGPVQMLNSDSGTNINNIKRELDEVGELYVNKYFDEDRDTPEQRIEREDGNEEQVQSEFETDESDDNDKNEEDSELVQHDEQHDEQHNSQHNEHHNSQLLNTNKKEEEIPDEGNREIIAEEKNGKIFGDEYEDQKTENLNTEEENAGPVELNEELPKKSESKSSEDILQMHFYKHVPGGIKLKAEKDKFVSIKLYPEEHKNSSRFYLPEPYDYIALLSNNEKFVEIPALKFTIIDNEGCMEETDRNPEKYESFHLSRFKRRSSKNDKKKKVNLFNVINAKELKVKNLKHVPILFVNTIPHLQKKLKKVHNKHKKRSISTDNKYMREADLLIKDVKTALQMNIGGYNTDSPAEGGVLVNSQVSPYLQSNSFDSFETKSNDGGLGLWKNEVKPLQQNLINNEVSSLEISSVATEGLINSDIDVSTVGGYSIMDEFRSLESPSPMMEGNLVNIDNKLNPFESLSRSENLIDDEFYANINKRINNRLESEKVSSTIAADESDPTNSTLQKGLMKNAPDTKSETVSDEYRNNQPDQDWVTNRAGVPQMENKKLFDNDLFSSELRSVESEPLSEKSSPRNVINFGMQPGPDEIKSYVNPQEGLSLLNENLLKSGIDPMDTYPFKQLDGNTNNKISGQDNPVNSLDSENLGNTQTNSNSNTADINRKSYEFSNNIVNPTFDNVKQSNEDSRNIAVEGGNLSPSLQNVNGGFYEVTSTAKVGLMESVYSNNANAVQNLVEGQAENGLPKNMMELKEKDTSNKNFANLLANIENIKKPDSDVQNLNKDDNDNNVSQTVCISTDILTVTPEINLQQSNLPNISSDGFHIASNVSNSSLNIPQQTLNGTQELNLNITQNGTASNETEMYEDDDIGSILDLLTSNVTNMSSTENNESDQKNSSSATNNISMNVTSVPTISVDKTDKTPLTGSVKYESSITTSMSAVVTATHASLIEKGKKAIIDKLHNLQKDLKLVFEVQNILTGAKKQQEKSKRSKRDLSRSARALHGHPKWRRRCKSERRKEQQTVSPTGTTLDKKAEQIQALGKLLQWKSKKEMNEEECGKINKRFLFKRKKKKKNKKKKWWHRIFGSNSKPFLGNISQNHL